MKHFLTQNTDKNADFFLKKRRYILNKLTGVLKFKIKFEYY